MLPIIPILLATLQQPQPAQATAPSPIARLVVRPARPEVTAGDTLRLTAQALDASGRPVANAIVRYQVAGTTAGSVDSLGLVTSGATGTLPIVVTAMLPGTKPVIQRLEVAMVPGAATRVTVAPRLTKLLAGQTMQLDVRSYSAAGDERNDRIAWRSSAPAVLRVAEGGTMTALAPGRATVTASAGRASTSLDITVVPSNVRSAEITPPSAQARQGDVIRFKSTVRDAAGTPIEGLSPQWTIAPGRGEIENDGTFVGYEAGDYVVTANFGRHTATARVTLTERDVRRKATVVGSVIRSKFQTSEVWIHPNGKIAYLGTILGGDRIYAIDISNPAKPVIVDSLVDSVRVINDVMTSEDGSVMVYSRENADNRRNGIGIASLADPLHPKKVADFTDGVTSGVHSAFIYTDPKHGRHAYITNDATGAVHVIDIRDPAHPKQVAEWRTPRKSETGRYVHDVDVQNGLLYGSWWDDGLIILDVGNGMKGGSPSNPKLVSQFKYDLEKLYKRVELEGGSGYIRGTHTAWRHKNYVFIGDEVFGLEAAQALFSGQPARAYGRLQVIDVSDIEHPKSVAYYEPEYGGVHNVWAAGDTLYIGAYNAGFRAFDISGELRGNLSAQGREIAHVATMSPEGKIPNAPMTWGVVVKNNLAYVNDFNSGLYIIRLEPKPPVVP